MELRSCKSLSLRIIVVVHWNRGAQIDGERGTDGLLEHDGSSERLERVSWCCCCRDSERTDHRLEVEESQGFEVGFIPAPLAGFLTVTCDQPEAVAREKGEESESGSRHPQRLCNRRNDDTRSQRPRTTAIP